MVLLHAAACDGRLFLWGEAPADSAAAEERHPRQKGVRAPLLPYDAGSKKLAEALLETSYEPGRQRHPFRQAVAWLPTVEGRPLPSSPLIADLPVSSGEPTITPWTVTALELDAERAISLLCACAGRPVLKPGVIVGNDLAYWVAAMRFAGAIVARQEYLPDAIQDREKGPTQGKALAGHRPAPCAGFGLRAVWKPVLAGPDAERVSKLAAAMPGVCRALTLEAASPPARAPSSASALALQAPASLLSAFLNEIVDCLARFSAGAAPPLKKKPRAHDSVHDQWLDALQGSHGTMEGAPAKLAEFAAQVREWQRPISLSTAGPYRLCFRLEEPADDAPVRAAAAGKRGRRVGQDGNSQGEWHVRYLLQATGDPSLLVAAEEVWSARGRLASLFRQGGVDAREYLLFSLGQASGICPRIEASLKKPAPGGYELDVSGAHEFLTLRAQALEQAGFGVLLPAWWTRKGSKVRLTARLKVKSPAMQGGGGLSLDTLLLFDWEVALGGEPLSAEELMTLASLKAPLVRMRGQWVELSAAEIQAALDFWKRRTSGSATAREIVRMALGATSPPGGLASEGVTATGWIADLLEQLNGRASFEELPAPGGFHGTLRPYQLRGYSWLAFLRRCGLGACLADDMGLGKTIQALALLQRDWESNGRRPALLICPTSVVGNWHKEAERFTPDLPVMVHHGAARTKDAAFREQAAKHAVVLSSYALLQRDIEILKEVPWAAVILDEAQNIKNPETKQAKAARALPADYRMALTGTPVENNVGDLWSLMEFLNPGFLGTQSEFKKTFFIPIQAGRDRQAAERLKRLTGPFLLRRLKTDKNIIADLPEKLEMQVFCTLTKEQASLYAAVAEEALRALRSAEGIRRKGVVLATLSKLKQVCNHPAHFLGDNSPIPGRSGKLTRLTEMLEEILEVGDRALIFSQFAEMGQLLRKHLQETFGREVPFLHGAVPAKQRNAMVESFQREGGGPPLFLLSLKAGGTGLNLTRANHVFHFDRWWNPAVENQATDRAFRIGQLRNVQVHKFVCLGTLEERIEQMIERKKEVAEKVIGAGEAWLTELSTAELKELFALRKEAVEQ